MDTAKWPQKPVEQIAVKNACPRPPLPPPSSPPSSVDLRKPRPQKEQALNCPRCHSTNTKFCYYNNYSLTQPRYFCKTCRRYWTEGGSLRSIPVGGGSRKNKRSSYNSSSSSIIMPPPPKNIKLSTIPDDDNDNNNNPSKVVLHEGQDLNLSSFPNISELIQQDKNTVATVSASSSSSNTSTTSHHHHHNFSALELITGITTTSTTSRGNLNNTTNFIMPVPSSSSSVLHQTHDDPNIGYTFPLFHHDFKPSSLNFSLDGIGSTSGFGSLQETTSGERILFPFEDLKHVSSNNTTMDQNNNNKEQQEDHFQGYWTGMLGGGSW